jgi:hypothetical protein
MPVTVGWLWGKASGSCAKHVSTLMTCVRLSTSRRQAEGVRIPFGAQHTVYSFRPLDLLSSRVPAEDIPRLLAPGSYPNLWLQTVPSAHLNAPPVQSSGSRRG